MFPMFNTILQNVTMHLLFSTKIHVRLRLMGMSFVFYLVLDKLKFQPDGEK